jgi:hypothetical protein
MAEIDDVFHEIQKLNIKLYGENGFEGDIPAIRKELEVVKDCAGKHTIDIALLKERVESFKDKLVAEVPTNKKVIGFGTTVGTAILGFIYFMGSKAGWWS